MASQAMTEIRHQSWEDVEPLFDRRTIALLPLGSTEPHGPHLPLDTDVVLAEALARAAAAKLEQRGLSGLVLPAIPYGITRLAQDFAGGVTLRPGTLWALVEDMALSLAQDGVQQLVLCNAHHEWEHTRVLSNLAIDYCERGEGLCQVIFPAGDGDSDSASLSEIECHGGRRETSLMLAVAPECVRADKVASLEPVELELPDPEVGVNRSLAKLGAERAYCGAPGLASAAEGAQLLADLAEGIVRSCQKIWPDLFTAR